MIPMIMPELSIADYRRLAVILQGHSGIQLPDAKRSMLEGRLRRRLRTLDLASFDDYCDFLFERGGLETEHSHLIDAVTTNTTDFFREPDHFTFLQQQAVPQLLSTRRPGNDRPLKIWSAASSIGAEAYTIAMVLAEKADGPKPYNFTVLGTDISLAVLEQAVEAIYPADMVECVPPELQRRYIMRSRDRSKNVVRIVPELRRLVRFQQLNLMDRRYPVDNDIDVIFCRNILIYFDKPTQRAVLERLSRHLRPGGYLILGHSESMAGANLRLKQVAPTVYCRR